MRDGIAALLGRRVSAEPVHTSARVAPCWEVQSSTVPFTPPLGTSSPLPLLDAAAAATWDYPDTDEHGFRTYQHVLVKHALGGNTLVSLPTGFGKTFVAAVVMRNFLRWFVHAQPYAHTHTHPTPTTTPFIRPPCAHAYARAHPHSAPILSSTLMPTLTHASANPTPTLRPSTLTGAHVARAQ